MNHPPQPDQVEHRPAMRAATLFSSFGYAFAGIAYLFRTQRNAQIHGAISVIVVGFGVAFQIAQAEWLAIIITIMIVVAAEGTNTAIEAVVDLASPAYHPLAKVAKDVAAGSVLLAAIGAVLVGLIIFLPRVWALLLWLAGWSV